MPPTAIPVMAWRVDQPGVGSLITGPATPQLLGGGSGPILSQALAAWQLLQPGLAT